MTEPSGLQYPVRAKDAETPAIKQLERMLNSIGKHPKLIGVDGEQIVIPDSVYYILRQAIELMASGHAISLVPLERELTTQEAADLLNVSRPYLVKLLEQTAIPYKIVGSHHRIRFEDLMAYKEQRDLLRHQSLRKITEISEEWGLYDNEIEDFRQEDETFEQ